MGSSDVESEKDGENASVESRFSESVLMLSDDLGLNDVFLFDLLYDLEPLESDVWLSFLLSLTFTVIWC